MLIVIGNQNLIENMISNYEVKKRNTGLKYKLLEEQKMRHYVYCFIEKTASKIDKKADV